MLETISVPFMIRDLFPHRKYTSSLKADKCFNSLYEAAAPNNLELFRRMQSSGMLCYVALVRTDILEERSASIIRVTRFGELVTGNVVPNSLILVTLMMEALHSSETSVLTRATQHNIPEDDTLYSHRRENLKSHTALTGCALICVFLEQIQCINFLNSVSH
jgi:hypothetical protein